MAAKLCQRCHTRPVAVDPRGVQRGRYCPECRAEVRRQARLKCDRAEAIRERAERFMPDILHPLDRIALAELIQAAVDGDMEWLYSYGLPVIAQAIVPTFSVREGG